jgi:hypothetical protein
MPAEPLVWMARTGYMARGVVFLIVGTFAFLAASGAGARPHGVSDSLQTVLAQPFGAVLLWIIALGLACFAGWRLLQGIFDADRMGKSLPGLCRRAGFTVSALFYLGLAAIVSHIPLQTRGQSEDHAAQSWTRWLMMQPFGRALVAVIGGIFIGVAIALVVKVIRAPYRHRLAGQKLTRKSAVALGSFGILTRAVVFCMIGLFLGYAAWYSDSRQAIGLAGALRTLQHQTYGGALLAVAACGLLAFGCFEILEAAARRVHAPKL